MQINARVDTMELAVRNRIDEEFETARIQTLIDSAADKYVEKKGKAYIERRVNETITPIKNEMDSILASANEDVEKISGFLDVLVVFSKARSDSKEDYMKLLNFSYDQDDVGKFAKNRIEDIERWLYIFADVDSTFMNIEHDSTWYANKLFVTYENGQTLPITKMNLDTALYHCYSPLNVGENILLVMSYIANHYPKKEIYIKSKNELETGTSLRTSAMICGILNYISEKKADFLDFDLWIKICEENLKAINETEKEK